MKYEIFYDSDKGLYEALSIEPTEEEKVHRVFNNRAIRKAVYSFMGIDPLCYVYATNTEEALIKAREEYPEEFV